MARWYNISWIGYEIWFKGQDSASSSMLAQIDIRSAVGMILMWLAYRILGYDARLILK